jgi:Pup amidohydrolase
MSVLRVMGTETEYGISVPGQPGANAMVTSSQIVNAYQAATAARARRARWDFEEENPLRDARGFDLTREAADSSQLTDEDLGLANVILTNGGRLYVDHAHPEYSAPECTNPLSVVIWDKAGERVMAEAATKAATVPGSAPIQLYKNNTDNKGASYGSHENYLMRRATPFADIVKFLVPFFVSRQVICGAGRVGIGADGRGSGFQISQRADFFEVEVGLETTLKRPIINTRDEPHADPEKYRRLHVIIGDANMSEVSTYLKVGTTSVVLAMIEDKFLGSDLSIDAPVAELRQVSHDPTCRRLITLKDGRKMTAVQLQAEYLELARKYTEDRYGDDVDDITADVLDRWESVLNRLAEDPMLLSRELDWVAKLELLEGYRSRDGLGWDHPRLQLVDLQYSDVRLDRGLYNRLAARGRMVRLTDDATVERAIENPPEDTRAYFRGRCLRQYPEAVAAASWDSVIFDIPGRESLQRVPTLEPLRGTRAHVGELLDRCRSAAELVAALTGQD